MGGSNPSPESAEAHRAARLAALARYRKKKALRALRPREELQRYKSRHTIATKRPRVGGRFVKTGTPLTAQ